MTEKKKRKRFFIEAYDEYPYTPEEAAIRMEEGKKSREKYLKFLKDHPEQPQIQIVSYYTSRGLYECQYDLEDEPLTLEEMEVWLKEQEEERLRKKRERTNRGLTDNDRILFARLEQNRITRNASFNLAGNSNVCN